MEKITLNNKKARLSWDEAEIIENEVKHRMEQQAEEIKDGDFPLENAVNEDEMRQIAYDSDVFSFEWDCLKSTLTLLMGEISTTGYWKAKVNNFGWRSLDGLKIFTANTGEELLQEILPKTDCTFYIFKRGKMLVVRNYHHDSPMGNEIYYIKPLSAKQYEKLS